MGLSTPLPARAAVRDLLTDLLSRSARVSETRHQRLAAEQPSLCGIYRLDDGGPAAVFVGDQDFAVRAGAALAATPLQDALPVDPAKGAGPEVAEAFHEVLNVLTKLLNNPTAPHVVLREMVSLPGHLAADAAELIARPGQRCDYRVELDGYGEGTITLLTR